MAKFGGGGRGGGGGMGMPSIMDILAEIVSLLSQAKLLPDAQANMQLINALEQGVLQIIDAMRKRSAAQAAQGPPPGGGPGGGPGGPPGMGGGPPGGDQGGPPGMGGQPPAQIAPGGGSGMAGFGTPNPDELRRTLAGPAAVGGG